MQQVKFRSAAWNVAARQALEASSGPRCSTVGPKDVPSPARSSACRTHLETCTTNAPPRGQMMALTLFRHSVRHLETCTDGHDKFPDFPSQDGVQFGNYKTENSKFFRVIACYSVPENVCLHSLMSIPA